MRNYLCFILVLVFLCAGTTLAKTVLNGTWQGTMEITPEQKLTIQFIFIQKAESLFAQATGQGTAEIYTESKDKFYCKVAVVKIRFNRNTEGRLESLPLCQNGQERPAKKLNI